MLQNQGIGHAACVGKITLQNEIAVENVQVQKDKHLLSEQISIKLRVTVTVNWRLLLKIRTGFAPPVKN